MRSGVLVPLPLPLYVTDTYLGGWNQFDLSRNPGLDLSTEIYYQPDPTVSGNYSTACFGERAFVRRRLALMKSSGLTPALHIMPHRLIHRNTTSDKFELMPWSDEGARVDGQFMNSVALFKALYLPILEELQLPYMLIFDFFALATFIPEDLDAPTFKRLYWDELSYIQKRLGFDKAAGGTNHHIRLKEYTPDRSAASFSFAVYLFAGGGPEDKPPCDPQSKRMSLLLSLGRPNGTGVNPYTLEDLALDECFWIHWYMFTPDIRACPLLKAGHQGWWNAVNSNQLGNFTVAKEQEAWAESVENLGPRYFFGYLHHFHNAVAGCGRRAPCNSSAPGLKHWSISGTETERNFLRYRAREKGLVLTSIWNDYEEACVLEPSVNTFPQPDVHSATEGGGTTGQGARFLENVIRGKLVPRLASYQQQEILPFG